MFLLLFTGKRDHYKLVHCYFVTFIRDQVIAYFELSCRKWRHLKFSLGVILGVIMFTFLRERGKLMSIAKSKELLLMLVTINVTSQTCCVETQHV